MRVYSRLYGLKTATLEFLQVFERLRRERGSLIGVQPGVVPITGDIARPGLGLSAADRAVLVSSVDIVFHCAATVRFNEKMKQALQTNLGGTNAVMQLCKDMHQLKVGCVRLRSNANLFC